MPLTDGRSQETFPAGARSIYVFTGPGAVRGWCAATLTIVAFAAYVVWLWSVGAIAWIAGIVGVLALGLRVGMTLRRPSDGSVSTRP